MATIQTELKLTEFQSKRYRNFGSKSPESQNRKLKKKLKNFKTESQLKPMPKLEIMLFNEFYFNYFIVEILVILKIKYSFDCNFLMKFKNYLK